MPPTLALILWAIFLIALLCFDPAKNSKTSFALWLPVIWMFITLSRLPSQWLGGSGQQAVEALEDGNPVDRAIYLAVILLSIGVLISRSIDWGDFLWRNMALFAFIGFGLLSVVWSDFPFIAFKRWFRDLGNYLVILLVMSDLEPAEAVRTFLRRLAYLLIPLSVMLIKYYPWFSIHYEYWTGAPEYTGAATSKNTLGSMCLIAGIFFFWDTVSRWSDRKDPKTRRILLLNLALMGMTAWLLKLSNSATSRVCLILGCLVILIVRSGWGKRHPSLLKFSLPAAFLIYFILGFGLDLNGQFAQEVGRDSSLTGRTNIWHAVLSTNTNPVIGTGYQSFWLGPRLLQVWRMAGRVNEAHNGYLDIYLNLGFMGLILLIILLFSTYRRLWKTSEPFSTLAPLNAAMWMIVLFYNMTEAAFGASFLCLTFLLGTLVVSRHTNLDDAHAIVPRFREAPIQGMRGSGRVISASNSAR